MPEVRGERCTEKDQYYCEERCGQSKAEQEGVDGRLESRRQ